MPLEGEALGHWLAARAGKLTGSRMAVAMSYKKNGEPTAERSNLMRELLAERLTGQSTRHYVNPAMQWGLDTEAEAKAAYEAETGEFIADCGYYDHPRIDLFGATPDGLLSHDGVLEIKCPTTATFVDWVMVGQIPQEHKPQMIVEILCTGRKWCEFVAFDPRMQKASPLFIRRFVPTAEEIAAVEAEAVKFLGELDALFDSFVATAA
jgi:putative phage-type endonuclease